ncbi:glycosyltransferase family 2 protein [bacterium]|nr:glycosyltransferase family 2 protein [bacterium]
MYKELPKVSVIIPHWKGYDILHRCLESLQLAGYSGELDIAVVDNACPDNSIAVVSSFENVRIVKAHENLGYAGGCNLGFKYSDAPFVVFLNNDTEVTLGWLEPMISMMLQDKTLAAVQPKMHSIDSPGTFDYCGAAGGEIDIFGYPYARGRMFDQLETDQGQYDQWPHNIFWATGAACMLRRTALDEVGVLEEVFFAHMEEIDLDWRLQWAGYRIAVVASSMVKHQTGGTLATDSLQKMAFNHRNSWFMLFRNLTFPTLCWIIPIRILLELMTFVWALLSRDWKRAAAVVKGGCEALIRMRQIFMWRKINISYRKINENILLHRMYRGSVALAFFLGHRITATSLNRK